MAWSPHHQHLLGHASPPTTTMAQGNEPRVARHVDIDANMVIILAVLLFALLCALGLNSVIRCALRCTSQHHHHHNRELGSQGGPHGGAASHGLKSSTIRQIPTTIYHITSSRTANNVMSMECMICLGEFIEGEKIKVLPKCRHGFHGKCINTWLLSHSTCPTCRQSLWEWAGNGAIVVSMGFGNATNSSHNEGGNGDGDGNGNGNGGAQTH